MDTIAANERIALDADGHVQENDELFTEYLDHPAMDELRKINLDQLTPIQAFDALRELKNSIK